MWLALLDPASGAVPSQAMVTLDDALIGAEVTSEVLDLPVLLRLPNTVLPKGLDVLALRAVGADGAALPLELESVDSANAYVWVTLDVGGSNPPWFWLVWGAEPAPTPAFPPEDWALVLHFPTDDRARDSTAQNAIVFATSCGLHPGCLEAGGIGSAAHFADATQSVSVAGTAIDNLVASTVSFRVKLDSPAGLDGGSRLVHRPNGSGGWIDFEFVAEDSTTDEVLTHVGAAEISVGPLSTTYHTIALATAADRTVVYYDGEPKPNLPALTLSSLVFDLIVGDARAGRGSAASFDEVRVGVGTRSADFLRLDHLSQQQELVSDVCAPGALLTGDRNGDGCCDVGLDCADPVVGARCPRDCGAPESGETAAETGDPPLETGGSDTGDAPTVVGSPRIDPGCACGHADGGGGTLAIGAALWVVSRLRRRGGSSPGWRLRGSGLDPRG